MSQKEIMAIIAKIHKNVLQKKYLCLHPECNEMSINSHLLQQKGILNHLAENNHLIEVKSKTIFEMKEGAFTKFDKIPVSQAVSFPLFCNYHDSQIFKVIETYPVDFTAYNNQLLFSYRSLCAELRKEEFGIEGARRILNAATLQNKINSRYLSNELEEGTVAFNALIKYKEMFEFEIANNSNRNFTFKTFKYEPIKIGVSAVFSVFVSDGDVVYKDDLNHDIFVNIIPQMDSLNIIIGYNNNYCDEWVVNYVKSWEGLTFAELKVAITDLIANRIETWTIAQSVYNSISDDKKREFLQYTNDTLNYTYKDSYRMSNFSIFD